jgi:hypothetical protein
MFRVEKSVRQFKEGLLLVTVKAFFQEEYTSLWVRFKGLRCN